MFFMSKSLAITLAAIFLSATAAQALKGEEVSTVDRSHSKQARSTDNDGRKLALGYAVTISPQSAPKQGVVNKAWQRPVIKPLKIDLPPSLDEAADVCVVNVKRLAKIGSHQALEVARWFGVYFKQLSGPPVISPANLTGQVPAANYKLYYMNDGRLKTVTDH